MSTNTHIITLQEAETLTHAYQNAQQFQGLTIASLTNSAEVIQLLNQPGCVGMRINFPLDSNISSNSILHSNFILYT